MSRRANCDHAFLQRRVRGADTIQIPRFKGERKMKKMQLLLNLLAFIVLTPTIVTSAAKPTKDTAFNAAIDIPPGSHAYLYFDGVSNQLKYLLVPSHEAMSIALPSEAWDALNKAPYWLRHDLLAKFVELSSAEIKMSAASAPASGDLDGDELADLVIGSEDGKLYYYHNLGTRTYNTVTPAGASLGRTTLLEYAGVRETMPVFEGKFEVFAEIDVGGFSAPVLVDLDSDGYLELVVGCMDGSIHYYDNLGTVEEPMWVEDPTVFEGIGVSAYSSPGLADLDGDSDFDLVVGVEDGTLRYYENVGTVYEPVWASEVIMLVSVSGRSAPTFADLNGDDLLDLIIGSEDGTLYYYENVGTAAEPAWFENIEVFKELDVGGLSHPAFVYLSELLTLIVGAGDGYVYYVKNLGTSEDPDYMIWTSGAEVTPISLYLWGPGYHPYVERLLATDPSFTHVYRYANLLLDIPKKLIDEVGFTVAYEPAFNLRMMPETYYLENAKAIYDMATRINYVRLLEKPHRHATTLEYVSEDGTWKEMPEEIYYKRVVAFNRYLLSPGGYFNHYPGLLYRTFLPYDTKYGMSLYDAVKDAGTITEAAYMMQDWIWNVLGARWHGVKPPGWYKIYLEPGGMCGEFSILVCSCARSVLIPNIIIVSLGEDHQWNEFWDNGTWHCWEGEAGQTGNIDNPSAYSARSAMMAWENDGEHDPTWPRTRYYTGVGTLKFTVHDINGEPIDGARVEVWSNWGWATYGIPLITMMDYTDLDGKAQVEVGYRPEGFMLVVISKLGSVIVTENLMVTEGETYEFEVTIPKAKPKVPEATVISIPESKCTANLEFRVASAIQRHPHWGYPSLRSMLTYGGWVNEYWSIPNGHFDLLVMDEINYQKYLEGYDFDAYYAAIDVGEAALTKLPMPAGTYIVISNEKSLTTTLTIEIATILG